MNEVKHDQFVIFQGAEYRFVQRNHEVLLVSSDPKDLGKGFERYSATKYIRKVSREEMDLAYRCTTHARYRDLECLITDIDTGKGQVLLRYFLSSRLAEEHGFREVDRMVYEKHVSPDEIEEAWYAFEPLFNFVIPAEQRKQVIDLLG